MIEDAIKDSSTSMIVGAIPSDAQFLLLENGEKFLLENGEKFLLEKG